METKDKSFILSLKEMKEYWLNQPDKTAEEIVDGVLFSLFVMIDGDSATNNFHRLQITEADTGVQIETGNLHDLYSKLVAGSVFKDKEIAVLDRIFTLLNIDDIALSYVNNRLTARKGDNVLEGAEFYKFLIEKAFIYQDDGSVLGIPNSVLDDFKLLASKYNVEVKDIDIKEPYKSYRKVKAAHIFQIVLFQVGDFFEAYNEDAIAVAKALDLTLATRDVFESQSVTMIGFPARCLDTYETKLKQKGFDTIVIKTEKQ